MLVALGEGAPDVGIVADESDEQGGRVVAGFDPGEHGAVAHRRAGAVFRQGDGLGVLPGRFIQQAVDRHHFIHRRSGDAVFRRGWFMALPAGGERHQQTGQQQRLQQIFEIDHEKILSPG